MIFTVGHSTQSPQEFVSRCKHAGIQTIIDVRSHPTSKWEWFDINRMEGSDSWLAAAGIGYQWLPDLGGWSSRDESGTVRIQPGTGMPLPTLASSGSYIMQEVGTVAWAARNNIDVTPYFAGYFPKHHVSKQLPDDSRWRVQGMLDYAWYTALPKFRSAAQVVISGESDGTLPNPALMCAEFLWWKCHRAMVADYLTYRGAEVTHVQPAVTQHSPSLRRRLSRYPTQVVSTWGSQIQVVAR